MNEAAEIVGMVDVLKLTYATLEQVRRVVCVICNLVLIWCADQFHGYN